MAQGRWWHLESLASRRALLLAVLLWASPAAAVEASPKATGLFKSLCAALGNPEVCRERVRRAAWASSSAGPFQPVADAPTRQMDAPWNPNRVVVKGQSGGSTERPSSARSADPTEWSSFDSPKPSLEIDFNNATYSVDDPTLPWRIIEYFANLQVEVSYVENVEKRKAYSEYLFRRMNAYLYSVGGPTATIDLAPRGFFTPEKFVNVVNGLSIFLVLVMTIMLAWFVWFLTCSYCKGQWQSPSHSSDASGPLESSEARCIRQNSANLNRSRSPEWSNKRSRFGTMRSRSCDDHR
ncbi:uncharacterized protein LOC144161809 [Haemaphysalis longicornis]